MSEKRIHVIENYFLPSHVHTMGLESWGDVINDDIRTIFRLMKYDEEKSSFGLWLDINQQRQIIKNIIKNEDIEYLTKFQIPIHKIWCIIDKKWFDQWKIYVNWNDNETSVENKSLHPGEIDNMELVEECKCLDHDRKSLPKLKRYCKENVHYEIIPSHAWDYLLKWYGGKHNGVAPTISRQIYKAGPNLYKIDLYPVFFNILFMEKTDKVLEFVEMRFSKVAYKVIKILHTIMVLKDMNPRFSYVRAANLCLWYAKPMKPFRVLTSIFKHELVKNEKKFMYSIASISDAKDGDFMIIEPRYLTNLFKLKKLSRTPKLFSGTCPFTSFMTLPPPEKKFDGGNEDYISDNIFKKWKMDCNSERYMDEMKEIHEKNENLESGFVRYVDPKFRLEKWKCYVCCRLNYKLDLREIVVVQIRKWEMIDIDESERRNYAIDMNYDHGKMKILKLSFSGGNEFRILTSLI